MSEVSVLLREGIAAAQALQYDRARPLLQRVTAEWPADPVGWFWLAIASPSASDAIPCLRRVLEIEPAHEQARTALSRLLLAEVNRGAAAGTRSQARALAAEAAELTPNVLAVWLTIAALSDDQRERIDSLRKAVTLAPDDRQVRTRFRQALLCRAVRPTIDPAEARACFREAATIDPDDPRVWQALAKLAETPADAVKALLELLRVSPDHPGVRLALRNALVADAQSLSQTEPAEKACARWREAIELTGGDVESWLGLAATTPNPKEAARAVETAYKLNPSDERAVLAMRRLESLKIDPATAAPPPDAFARFAASSDAIDAIETVDESLAELDSTLDAFGALPVPEEHDAAPGSEPQAEPEVVATVAVSEIPAAELAGEVEVELDAPAPVVSEPPAPPPTPVAAGANGSSKRTVMIVDDSPTIRKILGLTLERAGYAVVAEPDGESAIARLVDVVPDLILLDIAMPKLDGYEVCKRIKQDARTAAVPVVMLSGKGALFDKVKGHMAGATEYLTKPFETPAVLAVVTNYCEHGAEAVHG